MFINFVELPTTLTGVRIFGIIGILILLSIVLTDTRTLKEFCNITIKFFTIYFPKVSNIPNDKIEPKLGINWKENKINTNRKHQHKSGEMIRKFREEFSKTNISAINGSRIYKVSKDFNAKFDIFKKEFEQFPQQISRRNNNFWRLDLKQQNKIYENEYEELLIKEITGLTLQQKWNQI